MKINDTMWHHLVTINEWMVSGRIPLRYFSKIFILIYWFLKNDESLLSVCRISNKPICKQGKIRFNATKRYDDKSMCKAIQKNPWIVNIAPVCCVLLWFVTRPLTHILWAKNTINDMYPFSSGMYFNNKNYYVAAWKHFLYYQTRVCGTHRSPLDFPRKGPAVCCLSVSLVLAWKALAHTAVFKVIWNPISLICIITVMTEHKNSVLIWPIIFCLNLWTLHVLI